MRISWSQMPVAHCTKVAVQNAYLIGGGGGGGGGVTQHSDSY
jgi:hypothetical protein